MIDKKKWESLDKEFYSFFQEHVFVFADLVLLQFGELVFDIFKFEKFLKYKGYDPYSDISIAQFVEKKYGIRAREMITELLA